MRRSLQSVFISTQRASRPLPCEVEDDVADLLKASEIGMAEVRKLVKIFFLRAP